MKSAVALLATATLLLVISVAWAGGLPTPAKRVARSTRTATVKAGSTSTGNVATKAAATLKATAPPHPFDFAHDIGMVEGDRRDSLWVMIADTTLAVGDSLTLISDEPNPDPDTYVTLISAAVAERLHRDPTFKMASQPGDVFYRLVAPPKALDCCIFGYAVRAPRSAFRVVSGRAEADLDGDGVPEHFQSCASIETLHPTVWSGEPLKGTLRWTRSYALGYDVEPNCPDSFGSK